MVGILTIFSSHVVAAAFNCNSVQDCNVTLKLLKSGWFAVDILNWYTVPLFVKLPCLVKKRIWPSAGVKNWGVIIKYSAVVPTVLLVEGFSVAAPLAK